MVAWSRDGARRLAVRSLDTVAADHLATRVFWRVHSVFARALNLMSEDGALLGVVLAPSGNAQATLVAEDAGSGPLPPLSAMVSPGQSVQTGLCSLDIGGRLALDLEGTTVWAPAPVRPTVAVSTIRERLQSAVVVAATAAPAGGFGPLLMEASGLPREHAPVAVADTGGITGTTAGDVALSRARLLLPRLAAAIGTADWIATHLAARQFSGLGAGLTPAGDDLLTGLALGLRAVWGELPAPLAAVLSRAVVGRTTDLAAARVRYAVAGHPDEATHEVLVALVSGDGGSITSAVRRLLDYGHTSGTDTLVGLVLGVRLGLETQAPASG